MNIKTSFDIWDSCNDFRVSTEFNHVKWVKVEDVKSEYNYILTIARSYMSVTDFEMFKNELKSKFKELK